MFKKFSAFCEALEVHYFAHKISPLLLILSQINQQPKSLYWKDRF